MANLTVTAAQVGDIFPQASEKFSGILAEAVTQGQALYQNSSGKYGLADANDSGCEQVRGIAMEEGGADHTIDILRRGTLEGYTLTAMSHDDAVYLSDTAGALSSTAGTMEIFVGCVVAICDATPSKAIFVDCDWLRRWS